MKASANEAGDPNNGQAHGNGCLRWEAEHIDKDGDGQNRTAAAEQAECEADECGEGEAEENQWGVLVSNWKLQHYSTKW